MFIKDSKYPEVQNSPRYAKSAFRPVSPDSSREKSPSYTSPLVKPQPGRTPFFSLTETELDVSGNDPSKTTLFSLIDSKSEHSEKTRSQALQQFRHQLLNHTGDAIGSMAQICHFIGIGGIYFEDLIREVFWCFGFIGTANFLLQVAQIANDPSMPKSQLATRVLAMANSFCVATAGFGGLVFPPANELPSTYDFSLQTGPYFFVGALSTGIVLGALEVKRVAQRPQSSHFNHTVERWGHMPALLERGSALAFFLIGGVGTVLPQVRNHIPLTPLLNTLLVVSSISAFVGFFTPTAKKAFYDFQVLPPSHSQAINRSPVEVESESTLGDFNLENNLFKPLMDEADEAA